MKIDVGPRFARDLQHGDFDAGRWTIIMKAFFRFYEELNDFLPEKKRKVRFIHEFIDRASVKDMIESMGVPHTEIDLILVNGTSVGFSYKVNDNDDISVYPVFESFDISVLTRLRSKPLREPKFILDVHLGRLSHYLRMLGMDSAYKNNFTKDEIIKISLDERRAILTRDRNLLKRNEITHGYWIRSEDPFQQVREVIERFHLENEIKEFSRCMECNGLLDKVEKEDVIDKIPEKVKKYHNDFYQCPGCRRIYWKGTHYDKMRRMVEEIVRRPASSVKKDRRNDATEYLPAHAGRVRGSPGEIRTSQFFICVSTLDSRRWTPFKPVLYSGSYRTYSSDPISLLFQLAVLKPCLRQQCCVQGLHPL